MRKYRPYRLTASAVLAAVLLAVLPLCAYGRAPQQRQDQDSTTQEQNRSGRIQANPNGRVPQNQEHLQRFIDSHRNQPLPDTLRDLQNLPGFGELPPPTQQRYRDQIIRLYNLPPQQRENRLNRIEGLERLSPEQRQRWRGAVQQLNSAPTPRRRMMARAILDLRQMPYEQREQVINSPAFRAQFSDYERSTIATLLTAEPYPPVATAAPPGP